MSILRDADKASFDKIPHLFTAPKYLFLVLGAAWSDTLHEDRENTH